MKRFLGAWALTFGLAFALAFAPAIAPAPGLSGQARADGQSGSASGSMPVPLAGSASGATTVKTDSTFAALVTALDEAVTAEGFAVVTRASASVGASRRGVTIPGNMVVGVFRNDYAVRMLAASIASGIEAPLRFYVTGNPDGTASLTWRHPTTVFAAHDGGQALQDMAAELDLVWAAIAKRATGG